MDDGVWLNMLPSTSISMKKYSETVGKKQGKPTWKSERINGENKDQKIYKWIHQSPQPLLSEITTKFPHLRKHKWVSNTLQINSKLTNTLL